MISNVTGDLIRQKESNYTQECVYSFSGELILAGRNLAYPAPTGQENRSNLARDMKKMLFCFYRVTIHSFGKF